MGKHSDIDHATTSEKSNECAPLHTPNNATRKRSELATTAFARTPAKRSAGNGRSVESHADLRRLRLMRHYRNASDVQNHFIRTSLLYQFHAIASRPVPFNYSGEWATYAISMPNAQAEGADWLAQSVPSRSVEIALILTGNRLPSSASLGPFCISNSEDI